MIAAAQTRPITPPALNMAGANRMEGSEARMPKAASTIVSTTAHFCIRQTPIAATISRVMGSGWSQKSGKSYLGKSHDPPVGFTVAGRDGEFSRRCVSGCVNLRIAVTDGVTKKALSSANVRLSATVGGRPITPDSGNGVFCPTDQGATLDQGCAPSIVKNLDHKRDLDVYYWMPGVVVDTNVRRVLARAIEGRAQASPSLTVAETRLAAAHVPEDPATSAVWNVAVMELGALVCQARSPRCGECPISDRCAWLGAGRPAYEGPPRRGQGYEGTDRKVRGDLLQLLRDAPKPLSRSDFDVVDPDPQRVDRLLDALVAEGFVEPLSRGRYRLPA